MPNCRSIDAAANLDVSGLCEVNPRSIRVQPFVGRSMSRATQPNYSHRAHLLVKPSMARFIALSVLLHLWMILLFGDASGTRGNGLAVGRTFLATLEGTASPVASAASSRGVRRSAANEGGSLREGARISPQPSSVTAPPTAAPENLAAQENAAPPAGPLAAPVEAPVFEKIPILTNEVKAAATPFFVAPIPVEPVAAMPPAPSASLPAFTTIAPIASVPRVMRDEAGFAVYVAPIVERAQISPAPTPTLATPTLPPLVKPTADREFASYAPPAVVAPPPVVERRPAPAAASVAPPVDPPMAAVPSLIPPPSVPISPGPLPASTTTRIEPLKIQPASNSPKIYTPSAPVTTTIAPIDNALPAPPTGAPVAVREVPAGTTAPAVAAPRAVSPAVDSSTGGGPPALLNFPLPIPAPAGPAVPPPLPRLDLDALRRQAREVGREGSGLRTLLPFATVAKEPPKKDMEKIFDKALKRPDCKDAYSDLGLAALIPLVRDAVKDGGCKW